MNDEISRIHIEFDRITYVTMCFNLGMESLSKVKKEKRGSYDDYYLKPLIKLCNNFHNLILFCDKECAAYISKHKSEIKFYPIIYELNLNELERWSKLEKYEKAFLSMNNELERREKMHYPEPIRNGCIVRKGYSYENALYTILNHSKIDFLNIAKNRNPYNSKYFYWIDCGCFSNKYSHLWNDWEGKVTYRPSGIAVSVTVPTISDEISRLIGVRKVLYSSKIFKWWFGFRKKYIWSMKNLAFGFIPDQVVAGFFGGDEVAIMKLKVLFDQTVTRFLENGLISSEQGIMTYIIKSNPDIFDVIISSKGYDGFISRVATKKE